MTLKLDTQKSFRIIRPHYQVFESIDFQDSSCDEIRELRDDGIL